MNQKEAIEALLNKAKSKLKTAQIDFDNNQYDDAVSRAYYAVFHAISATLLSKNLVYSSHSQTIGAFNKEFVKTNVFPKDVTAQIQALYEERQTGDYDAIAQIDEETAQECISQAKRIIILIEQYLTENLIKK